MNYNLFSQSYASPYTAYTSEPRNCAHVHPCIPTHTTCTPKLWNHHPCFEPCNPTTINIRIPPCPQPEPKPEPKEPIDFSKLAILINPVTGEILDATTKESTGKNFKECQKIIEETKNDLEIGPNNKLIGGCDSDASCKACVDAINSSISDSRKVTAFFSEEMSVPEDTFEVI
ncbi:hypothetical protein [Wolbachia endosymbiont (group A) of Beris morrisii]|uniref:hypothetical protein n=1 Tax=unclassified Wolbachia TaxID=2640676 RepID=UPI00333FF193